MMATTCPPPPPRDPLVPPHLDTGHDVLLLQAVCHLLAGAGGLEECLLEHDGTADVLAQAGGGHQQLTVGAAVVLGVLEGNALCGETAGGGGCQMG
jgi:hypothetical protein